MLLCSVIVVRPRKMFRKQIEISSCQARVVLSSKFRPNLQDISRNSFKNPKEGFARFLPKVCWNCLNFRNIVIIKGKLNQGGGATQAAADVTIDACVTENSISHPSLASDMQSLCGVSSSIGQLIGYTISGFLVHLIASKDLHLDSENKSLRARDSSKQVSYVQYAPVEPGTMANGMNKPFERPTSPFNQDFKGPSMFYSPNGYTSPTYLSLTYYYGGYDGSSGNKWDGFASADGFEMPQGR